jgi:ergothioneine biosynthesis protein EgtB
MTDSIDDPIRIRTADAGTLAQALVDAREHTLGLFGAVRAALGDGLEVPYADQINPPLWELGHVAWFEEFWIARNTERLRGVAARLEAPRAASLLPAADALYDSSQVAHAKRWHLDLPDVARSLGYAERVRERSLALLRTSADDDDALYFFRLALLHEAMHLEAGIMIAQGLALDVSAALGATTPRAAEGADATGELAVPAAKLTVGAPGAGFAFDNEFGAHRVDVPASTIDRGCVTWGAYLPFIEAGGYDDAKAWTPAGWAWRRRELPAGLPRYLRRDDDGRLCRACFGRWTELDLRQPAVNLSQHEAQAWCTWAGRRLPTEHEWTLALEHTGPALAWGEVWEWTASPFEPYPGFTPHPYRDYSQPWFDGRPVLKGGSFATPPRLKHPGYRNFFPAGRNDVFAGFRSCAA